MDKGFLHVTPYNFHINPTSVLGRAGEMPEGQSVGGSLASQALPAEEAPARL